MSVDVGNTMVGAAGWAYLGETSSQRLRVYTAGLGSACNTTIGVVMNVLTPYMVNKGQWDWGLKVGWFYVGVGAPCVIAVWLLIPETTGYVLSSPLTSCIACYVFLHPAN